MLAQAIGASDDSELRVTSAIKSAVIEFSKLHPAAGSSDENFLSLQTNWDAIMETVLGREHRLPSAPDFRPDHPHGGPSATDHEMADFAEILSRHLHADLEIATLLEVRSLRDGMPSASVADTLWMRANTIADPTSFYCGGRPSLGDIESNFDVLRTQYVAGSMSDSGERVLPWRETIIGASSRTRFVALYGHRGSGKTTLMKRIARDALAAGVKTADFTELLPWEPIKRTDMTGAQVLLMELDDCEDSETVSQFLSNLRVASLGQPGMLIIFSIDTNRWRHVEHRVSRHIRQWGFGVEPWHLNSTWDERECNDLAHKLRQHGCLFRLKDLSHEEVLSVFASKARRSVVAALLEATHGTNRERGLAEIIRTEFGSLPPRAQEAYFFAALLQSEGAPPPDALLERALGDLIGDPSYLHSPTYARDVAEILFSAVGGICRTRDRLIARVLVLPLRGGEWDSVRWRSVHALLNALDSGDRDTSAYVETLSRRRALRVLSDLSPCTDEIVRLHEAGRLSNRDAGGLLNSVARVCQSRREYKVGARAARASIASWESMTNPGHHILAYCLFADGQREDAVPLAKDIASDPSRLLACLHGIRILTWAGEMDSASEALRRLESVWPEETLMRCREYEDLAGTIRLWNDFKVGITDLDGRKPKDSLSLLQNVMEDHSPEEEVVEAYRRLAHTTGNWAKVHRAYFRFLLAYRDDAELEQVLRRTKLAMRHSRKIMQQAKTRPNKYPAEILAAAEGSKGRAIFIEDRELSGDAFPRRDLARELVQAAVTRCSSWPLAHSWLGTIYKDAYGDYEAAEQEYRIANSLRPENPMYLHNLALLKYSLPEYSTDAIREAIQLNKLSLVLAENHPEWRLLLSHIDNLQRRLAEITTRRDLRDGDALDQPDALDAPDAG